MDAQTQWVRPPDWLDEARNGPRWPDNRTALAKIRGEEYLGKVRDLSLGGLGLALGGDAEARRGERVEVVVVFERRMLDVSGQIAHARYGPEETLLGVACDPLPAGARQFLTERYAGPSARGRVK